MRAVQRRALGGAHERHAVARPRRPSSGSRRRPRARGSPRPGSGGARRRRSRSSRPCAGAAHVRRARASTARRELGSRRGSGGWWTASKAAISCGAPSSVTVKSSRRGRRRASPLLVEDHDVHGHELGAARGRSGAAVSGPAADRGGRRHAIERGEGATHRPWTGAPVPAREGTSRCRASSELRPRMAGSARARGRPCRRPGYMRVNGSLLAKAELAERRVPAGTAARASRMSGRRRGPARHGPRPARAPRPASSATTGPSCSA